MQHTAHHAIKARLNMWRLFFANGLDTTPAGAEDSEYGLDNLIDLAMTSDSTELHALAGTLGAMEQEYMLKLDDQHAAELLQRERYAAAMMRDDLAGVSVVTIDEFSSALGNSSSRYY